MSNPTATETPASFTRGLFARAIYDELVFPFPAPLDERSPEEAKVIRFFPNRFARDSRVAAAQPLTLPGAMRFQLTMNTKGVPETISCFATQRDVMASLPQALVGTDFEPLPGASLELIRGAFLKASGGTLAQENFRVQAK